MPDCINLKEHFGDEFKVVYEESYYAERTRHTVDDPWLMIIPCRHGHIFPWGGELLAVSTDKRGPIAKTIASLPFVTVEQDGADGINATFHASHFVEIAEIMKPKKRRQVSDAERARLAEMGRQHRFQRGVEFTPSDPERAQEGTEVSGQQEDPAA